MTKLIRNLLLAKTMELHLFVVCDSMQLCHCFITAGIMPGLTPVNRELLQFHFQLLFISERSWETCVCPTFVFQLPQNLLLCDCPPALCPPFLRPVFVSCSFDFLTVLHLPCQKHFVAIEADCSFEPASDLTAIRPDLRASEGYSV